MNWTEGQLVWFDPGLGHSIPGEIEEVHQAAQVITVKALIKGKYQSFTLQSGEGNLQIREDIGEDGLEDMTMIKDLHEASLLWNLRLRYEKGLIYTFAGSILVAVNPYKMIPETYGLEMAKQYAGKPLGSLPPHLFAIAAAANAALPYPQVVVISGESGSGKTESTKLVMQYLAAVVPGGGNASALINEQILEAAPLLESFGNARTVRNDNSSRFGKYLEVFFKNGSIVGAKITQYLLEKSRIVTQSNGEQNYHVFYEMLNGISETERSKYGLLEADKYFYLNQGGLKYPSGRVDWQGLLGSMQVLGISESERESIIKVLSSVLHLGNIYFHRRQLRHGQEGVEVGSDAEIKWAAHLLQISAEGLHSTLTSRITETKTERLHTPLGIDQALDSRDAFAKALYSGLFNWLVSRINMILHKGGSHNAYKICILDIFGFENLEENSFEQLCINYANENLQLYFNKHVFKLEQAEYAKENLEWSPLTWEDNLPVIHLLAKKPVGIFHLLDDESNFPCGTDLSFLEKSHYNHALNDLYSRPRIGAQDFGINHYAGTVWYCVDGFLDKNRDYLRADVLDLLESSSLTLVEEITKHLKAQRDYGKTLPKGHNGRFVTMKPRTPTVAARFSDSLQQLLQSMGRCNPWFVRCIKPNNDKQALKMDMPCVMQQLRYLGMLDTIKIRQRGYPVRLRFQHFVDRYRYVLKGTYLHGTPYRDLCRLILDTMLESNMNTNDYQLGATRIFLREGLHRQLEIGRADSLKVAANVIQRNVRGMLVRRKLDRKNKAALKIQSVWRGHRQRKQFKKLRNGVVKLQALHRGRVVRKKYLKMKRDLRYRKDSSRSEQSHHIPIQIQNHHQTHVQKKSITQAQPPIHKKSDVNELAFLDIPAELSYLFKKVEDWTPVHGDRHLTKVAGVVSNSPQSFEVPNDVDQFAFGKFSSVYCNDIKLCPRSEPISSPFMSKAASKDQDFVDSIAIFKLILRWSKDESLRGNSEKMLVDYIISKGQNSYALRDEILVQICNQLYGNPNEMQTQKLWFLMDQCLSSFKSSNVFKKYLLKFILDNSPKNLTESLVKKVLRKSFLSHRNFPTSWIEWRAFHKFSDIALCLVLPDETAQTVAIDSWTTCEEAASLAVQDLNINGSGWTVVLDDGKVLVDSSGLDFVLDMISEVELFPSFPVTRNDLFKYGSKFDRFILPNGEVKRPQVPPPDPPKISITSDKSLGRSSQGRKLSNDILSRNSALNERYFEKEKSRSRSMDNLLLDDNETEPEKDLTAFANIGLSKSKLNERYHSTERLNPTNNELTPRYTKYQSGSRRSYASSHSKHMEKPEYLSRSSAMSDTSEAPSLASHVKRVRVPSQASDVDQFLDDLFRPVLDGSLDELSDARSLAASIRGRGKDDNFWDSIPISSDLNSLQNGSNISRQIKGGYSPLDSVDVLPELDSLSNKNKLSQKIKGGGTAHESASNSPELISAPQTPLSSADGSYQDQIQRAFLQSAMAQNLQIQQQLLAQNQALQTLLQQQQKNPGAVQISTTKVTVQKAIIPRQTRKISAENGEVLIPPPPPPPMPPPIEFKDPSEARPFLDPYGRAKTVRIGKWRWPPPNSNQIHETEEDFLMFKMRQNQRKTTPQARFNGDDDDWQDFEIEKKKSVISKETITISTADSTDSVAPSSAPVKSKKKSFEVGAQRPPPGSVGKLKLSSEMRQRLEQLTAGHSVRSNVSKKSDHQSPSKLENTKRMLLEQQLGMVGVVPPHMRSFEDIDKWQGLPPAPSVAAPPPPIHPPSMAPPKPPPVPVSPGEPIKEYKQPSVPKYFQRQENDIFGARSEWESVEIAKEMSEMSIMSMDQNRARSRSRSRDRDDFSESIWDRSEVEGHSLSDKEREKEKEKSIEDKQEKEIVSKRSSFMPVTYKTTARIETDSHSQITPSPTFKTHMAEKYEHERKIKTINRKENGTSDWERPISIPAPVPLPSSAKTSNTSLTYNRVNWKLRVRKEFFFPKEQVKSPAAIDLIFLQIVADVFETAPCLRLSMQEKNSAKNMLSSHGISVDNVRQQKIPISVKKYLIDMARSWALYFSRIFCVQGPPQYPDICVMAVSENGIYLARRDNDSFLVLHSFNFNNVDGAITLPRPTALQLNLSNGNRIVLHTTRASIIQHMVSVFLQEYKQIHVKPVLETRKSSSPQYPIKEVQRKRSEENFSYLNGGVKEIHNSSENIHKAEESRIQVMHMERAVKQRISKQENSATMDSNSEMLSKTRKYTLTQFASKYFRNENENEEMSNKKLMELVRWQGSPIRAPLLRLPVELSDLALECFECILRYCGDIPLDIHLTEVKCVYTVLMHCHKYLALRDEVYCQLMKQTTANNSPNPDSIQRAWRLFSILAAYFGCSDALHPYLVDHLSSIASDRRKPCYGTAAVCLANLRKTARCGGRKNVPSVDEVTAVSVGRSARRQIYRLPGGSERVVNTRCSTVVADVIAELCNLLGIHSEEEQQEFSLYCIVEGDAFTLPLSFDEYILDVTTELLKSGQPFYLIFCRSIWHFPLKRDPVPSPLYIEVLFNQVMPDYLEGLLFEMPANGVLSQESVRDISRLAAILHRAADLNHVPTMKEIKFLLPKPILAVRDIRPMQWVQFVQTAWPTVADLSPGLVKAQFLNVLSKWPLFGSSFFAVKRIWKKDSSTVIENSNSSWKEMILVLNRQGVMFLDPSRHETLQHWHFMEVISTRKVRSEDNNLFLDMKVGNLMQQRVIRVQTEQAHEISRLIRQYITLAQYSPTEK